MDYNAQKSVWFNDNIQYLFDSEIIEYDISDAGMSLIKEYKLLPDDEIKRLLNIEKGFNRHKEIGLLQKYNSEFSKQLANRFADIRYLFINTNNLSDEDIISVKKDAFFIIGNVKKTKFGKIEFKSKNSYSSYIRFINIQNLEIYYSDSKYDIKGIGDRALNRHRLYLLNFIISIIKGIENKSTSVKRKFINFINDYKAMKLDDEYYLEFNNKSIDINPIFNYKNILIPLSQILLREVI